MKRKRKAVKDYIGEKPEELVLQKTDFSHKAKKVNVRPPKPDHVTTRSLLIKKILRYSLYAAAVIGLGAYYFLFVGYGRIMYENAGYSYELYFDKRPQIKQSLEDTSLQHNLYVVNIKPGATSGQCQIGFSRYITDVTISGQTRPMCDNESRTEFKASFEYENMSHLITIHANNFTTPLEIDKVIEIMESAKVAD